MIIEYKALGDGMEFLIFSDSHGKYYGAIEAFERQIQVPDAVFFLGDGVRDMSASDFGGAAFFSVRGNCDLFAPDSAPAEMTLSFEGHRILLCHGHFFGVKSGYGALISHAAELEADIVLFGHTHRPYEVTIPEGFAVGGKALSRPMYLFNPGSLGQRSFGTLSLRGDQVLFSHGSL